MHSGNTTKLKSRKPSLTDSILQLCASGRFGVREAIAVAIDQQKLSLPTVPEKLLRELKSKSHR